MSGVPNCLRRGGVYHFRRWVPISLREIIRRSELMRSLRTNDPVLARSRSRRLYLQSEALFGLVGNVPMLDDRQISSLVQRFYVFELEDEYRMRVSTGVRFDEANRQAAIAYFERLGIQVRDALARNELERADEWVKALLAREGIADELDPTTTARLQQAILRASCDVAAAMKGRFEGEFVYEPLDPILSLSEAAPEAQMPSEPVAKSPVLAGPDANPALFRERAEELRQNRLRRGIWDKQTAFQARKTYALFAEHCGDRPLAGYVREDAARFLNLLSDLPANYGKAAKYRGMTGSEVAALSSGEAEVRLSPRSH